MGQTINLTAKDGHKLSAYEAKPAGAARGGLVVIQEIFGVNNHMRKVSDGFAADGYHCITPALFDRVAPGIETGYTPEEIAKGREARGKLSFDQTMLDAGAALAALKAAGHAKIGIVGYCFGGTVTWLGAARLDGFSAASSYYGGGIGNFAGEQVKCPTICHFGEKDTGIPAEEVNKIKTSKQSQPVEVFVYPNAGHGFNCDERGSYDAASAKQARERTLAHFRKYIG